MNLVAQSILECLGNAPPVVLRKNVPPGCARVAAKLEGGNPTGNIKDRMAKAAIAAVAADGRLGVGGKLRSTLPAGR